MTEQTRVTLSGPLFKKDIETTVRGAIKKTVTAVATAGQADYKAALVPGRGLQTGRFKRTIKRRSRGMSATVWSSNAPIAAWLEGKSKRNRTTRFKGYELFAESTKRTDRTAGAEARRLVDEIVKALN